MKPIFVMFVLACGVVVCGVAAEVEPRKRRLAEIDLDLALEQYKQARMEQFRAEMQLKFLQIDERLAEAGSERERVRVQERLQILKAMAEEIRAKAARLEEELSSGGAAGEKVRPGGESGQEPGGTARGELRKQMLGTWQLMSYADGRVSPANEGELKFIGDRHWSVSHLNPRTDRLDYHMGGTYTLTGDEYVETIEFANEAAAGSIGETYTYKLTVEGDRFTQMGVGNPYSLIFKRAK